MIDSLVWEPGGWADFDPGPGVWVEELPPDPWLTAPGLDPDSEQGAAGFDSSEVAWWRDRLASAVLPGEESALIDLLRGLEDLKSCAAAVQARAAVAFETARRQAEAEAGVPGSRRGAGVGAEVALARRESPYRGGRLLGLARALVTELPATLTALADGALNEWRATLVARETACLEVEDRLTVDTWLAAYLAGHPGVGDRRLVAELRRQVIGLDQDAVVRARGRAAGGRRVSLRPLPEGMVRLTAVLPLAQGVAAYAVLVKEADRRADKGGRGAVMADTLIERITGQDATTVPPVELMVVITDQALLGADTEPAEVQGYGPVSAAWVRQLIAAAGDAEQAVALRRLFRPPGRMIQLESSRRLMGPGLRRLIAVRDQRCRTPWCDAPIRHADHVRAHADGGATSLVNGQGLCAGCNYAKQQPGWAAAAVQDPARGHVVTLTTPTGHRYQSTPPTGPGDR